MVARTFDAVIADELPLVRAGLRGLLTSRGVTVVGETHSGRDLVSLADMSSPSLVVVGTLADRHELDAIERLTTPHPAPLVVALVSAASEPLLAPLLAAGADGVARRTGTVDELDELIGRVLDGERVVAPSLTERLPGAFAEIDLDALDGQLDGDGATLSAREFELLVFLAQGRSNKEIADQLSLSLATVKSHLVRMYAKLEVSTRGDALAAAVSRGLLA